MRYCLSSRQPDSVLKKADEIKIALRDYDAISYYIDEFSDKTIILEMDKNFPKGFDWDVIQAYSEKMNGNFYCALRDLTQVNECKSRDIKFYYKYQINTLFELEGLKQIGVSYILSCFLVVYGRSFFDISS